MKKLLAPLLAFTLLCATAAAAPLTDFHNNTFQIDVGFCPIVSQSGTNASGPVIMPNVSDYSGNLTYAFTDFVALRLGMTSLTNSTVSWNNIDTGVLGLTQANLQVVVNPSEYIQPFFGLQYAVSNFQNQTGGNWKNLDYKQTGICGGLQLTLPLTDLFKLNANGMYGTYFSSAYAGITLCLFGQLDIDGGYVYEYYNTGSLDDSPLGAPTSVSAQGLRMGVSLRI
ncbi:MAG: hypothetical protein WCV63_05110 [Negativicutes bacterium]|jgi:hypothetical protein